MRLNAFAAFAAILVFGLSQAVAETRTAPSGTQPRPPTTNYSINPNAAKPKIVPGGEAYFKACAQIRSDCETWCKAPSKTTAQMPGNPICDKPCSGWTAPLCNLEKSRAGCGSPQYNPNSDAAKQMEAALGNLFGGSKWKSCASMCVYNTDASCADTDTDVKRINSEIKNLKITP
jgi:hypothetical protein